MRFVIAAAALFMCVYEGIRRSLILKKRAEFLAEIHTMLDNFSSKIILSAPTLEELIAGESCRFARTVAEKASENIGINSAWESACLALPQKNEERALLSEFGKALINSGAAGATDVISVYSEKIARLERQARDDYSKKGGAVGKIWALCGIAAAILIV